MANAWYLPFDGVNDRVQFDGISIDYTHPLKYVWVGSLNSITGDKGLFQNRASNQGTQVVVWHDDPFGLIAFVATENGAQTRSSGTGFTFSVGVVYRVELTLQTMKLILVQVFDNETGNLVAGSGSSSGFPLNPTTQLFIGDSTALPRPLDGNFYSFEIIKNGITTAFYKNDVSGTETDLKNSLGTNGTLVGFSTPPPWVLYDDAGQINFTDWQRRVPITQNTLISPLNTPFVSLITEANLPAEIFTIARSDGGDLRVGLSNNGTNMQPLEVVTFDTVNNKAVLWCRTPELLVGQQLWIYYGNANETQPAVTDPLGRNAVWADYRMVDHGGNLVDSTGNTAPVMTGSVGIVAGKIGDAYGQTTSSNFITYPSAQQVTFPYTIQAWANRQNNNTNSRLIGIGSSSSSANFSHLTPNPSNVIFRAGNNSEDSMPNAAGGAEWTLIHGVARASNDYEVYQDTNTDGASTTNVTLPTSNTQYRIGASADSTPFGVTEWHVEEARIRKDALTLSHISTEYDNQSSPSTFWTTGTPENTTGGGGGTEIDPPLVTSETTVQQPEVLLHPAIDTALITSEAVVFESEFLTGILVQVDQTTSEEEVYNPTVLEVFELELPRVEGTPFVYEFTLPDENTIELEVVDSEVDVFNYEVIGNKVLDIPVVEGIATPLTFTVLQAQTLDVPRVDADTAILSFIITDGDGIIIPEVDRRTLNTVAAYLRTQGFSGSTNDVILQWLISEGYEGQINDALCNYWSSLNLEGAYNDKESEWKRS